MQKETPKENLYKRVEEVLETIRPFLHRDQGDVELVKISADKVVSVALKGNCVTCPMSAMTMQNGIAKSITSVIPEIKKVQAVNIPSPKS